MLDRPPATVAQTDHKPAEAWWSVRLLGAVEAYGVDGQSITRWPSRAVAALLARLALEPDRAHPREELVELLWPGVPLDVSRNRLRQVLSTLKRLLEPDGSQAPPVVIADRQVLRVRPGALDCDARRFEALARAGDVAAHALYRGELMPGHYDDWVLDLRRHLAERHERLTDSTPLPHPGGAELPGYRTRPFGMEPAASRLRALVAKQRLVTVHGPGGSGKTRLAVAVAQALRDDPAWSVQDAPAPRFDNIEFVGLVDCVRADSVLDALGEALRTDPAQVGRRRVVSALQQRRTLLVLDNLEQLAPDAIAEVSALLAALPGLHVLATSRRLLQVEGEWAFGLDGLALPAPNAGTDEAAVNAAVSLFVDRARAGRADFKLSAVTTPAVVGLVRLLAGMPLAIELAASRMRGMSAQDLLERLRQDAGTPTLDLLTRPQQHADVGVRHASLRHMVGWSWDQLSPAARDLLSRLSVLAAPAPLAAVAAVAGQSAQATEPLLDQLRDASMLQSSQDEQGQWRHVLLQPVREFANERLPVDAARAARSRLRAWLLGLAGCSAASRPAVLGAERAHLQAALLSAPADDAAEQALALAAATRILWARDPPAPTVLAAVGQCAQQAADSAWLSGVCVVLAHGWFSVGDTATALRWAERALETARHDGERSQALTVWTRCRYVNGLFETDFDASLAQAVQLAQRAGDDDALAAAYIMQALVACNFRLDYTTAERLVERAQVLWQRVGDADQALYSLLYRATMWAWQGRNEQAALALTEVVDSAQARASWSVLIMTLRQLGRVNIRMRRWADAELALRRSLDVAWQHQLSHASLHALLHLPMALAAGPHAALAARLHGFATAEWARRYGPLNRIEKREMQCTWRWLRLRLGAARAEALRSLGATLDLGDAVALAMAARPAAR